MNVCFVQLRGGLGNQLFQIATTWAYCKRYGYTLHISLHTEGGRPVYWDSFLHNCKKYIGPSTKGLRWKEPSFSYSSIPEGCKHLYGYFQSSRYFSEYRQELLELFDPCDSIKAYVAATYESVLSDATMSTVLHIRRGDYLNTPDMHGILTPDYYRRAVGQQQRLVVFSDDILWCRTLEFLKDATFIDEPNESAALYLMSRFEQFILSNSSFSWWAAWIANAKTVIVPDQWFGPKGPQDYQDIYEPGWIRVPVVQRS